MSSQPTPSTSQRFLIDWSDRKDLQPGDAIMRLTELASGSIATKAELLPRYDTVLNTNTSKALMYLLMDAFAEHGDLIINRLLGSVSFRFLDRYEGAELTFHYGDQYTQVLIALHGPTYREAVKLYVTMLHGASIHKETQNQELTSALLEDAAARLMFNITRIKLNHT